MGTATFTGSLLLLACQTLLVCAVLEYPPSTSPISINITSQLVPGSIDFPLDFPPVASTTNGRPEQIHVTYWGPGRALVSWVTGKGELNVQPRSPAVGSVEPCVSYGYAKGIYIRKVCGVTTTYTNLYPTLPSYASPLLHHVLLTGLTGGSRVWYQVGTKNMTGPEYSFKVVRSPSSPGSLPFRITLVGDMSQTLNSSAVLRDMVARPADLTVILGDLAYADNWQYQGYCNTSSSIHMQSSRCLQQANPTCPQGNATCQYWCFCVFESPLVKNSPDKYRRYAYQPKWDAWGRLYQPLFATVPMLHTNGNHEIEAQPDGTTFEAYNARFPAPINGGNGTTIDVKANTNKNANETDHNMYYSVNVPGAHMVFLSNSIVNDTFGPETRQYRWLEADLQAVQRNVTPWVIVSFHAPWYNTFSIHFLENECMRQAYEPLLYKYGVDLVFTGHTHGYQRTVPVYRYRADPCAPVHVMVGSGGKLLDNSYIEKLAGTYSMCSHPFDRVFPEYQPQRCWPKNTTADGNYCYTSVPDWVAYRECNFGFGQLTVLNATAARWLWVPVNGSTTSDSVVWVRGSKTCSNRN